MTGVERLNADIQRLSLSRETATHREVRAVVARARRINRTDLLPDWMLAPGRRREHAMRVYRSRPPILPDLDAHDPTPVLEAKSAASQIPCTVLREVYCREFIDPIIPELPAHLSRQYCAHARVNAFIRLSQGDTDARTDDADLLSLLT